MKKNQTVHNSKSGKNTQLIQREEIPNTPFTAIKIEKEPYFLTLGKYRIPGYEAETIEEMRLKIEQYKWNLILDICGITAEFNNK